MNEQQEANEPQSGEGFEKIDSRILAKLNEFDATTRRKESCMSCGYVGVMGIGEEIQPWWLSWWCIVLIAIFGSLFMGAGLVIGAGRWQQGELSTQCPCWRRERQRALEQVYGLCVDPKIACHFATSSNPRSSTC